MSLQLCWQAVKEIIETIPAYINLVSLQPLARLQFADQLGSLYLPLVDRYLPLGTHVIFFSHEPVVSVIRLVGDDCTNHHFDLQEPTSLERFEALLRAFYT